MARHLILPLAFSLALSAATPNALASDRSGNDYHETVQQLYTAYFGRPATPPNVSTYQIQETPVQIATPAPPSFQTQLDALLQFFSSHATPTVNHQTTLQDNVTPPAEIGIQPNSQDRTTVVTAINPSTLNPPAPSSTIKSLADFLREIAKVATPADAGRQNTDNGGGATDSAGQSSGGGNSESM